MSQAPPDTDGIDRNGSPHERFAESTVHDKEISENNFGAGFYQNSEVYEQTQRFKQTLNAQASVGQSIERLAMSEVFQALATAGWEITVDDQTHHFPPLDEATKQSETEYANMAAKAQSRAKTHRQEPLEYGRQLFETMPDYLQTHAMTELSTLDGRFDPPEMRVTKFFHEATRSKGGRLMDNVFGRVKKLISQGNQPDKKTRSRLFGGD
jgi:hypothetical protein